MAVYNERGSMLVTVLVVMVTLVILGTTLLGVGMNDQRQAVRHQSNSAAYYLARSGADAVATHLFNNPKDIYKFVEQGQDEIFLETGRVVVTVTDNAGVITINSRGYVGRYSESVELKLIPDTSFPVFDMAIFAEGRIFLDTHAKVIGDVGTNSTVNNDVNLSHNHSNIDGDVWVGVGGDPSNVVRNSQRVDGSLGVLDERREYPLPIFPDFPDLDYKGTVTGGLIDSDGYYDNITVSGTLTIDIGSGTRRIRVKNLTVNNNGAIKLVGTGQLILYVESSFVMGNSPSITNSFNADGTADDVIIYYSGANTVNIGNQALNVSLYAQTADVTVGNGFTGNLFSGGSSVNIGNNGTVRTIYAPYAHVDLPNGGVVNGAIICNTIDLKQSTIHFNPKVQGVWGMIPQIEFSEEFPPVYSKGFWSN